MFEAYSNDAGDIIKGAEREARAMGHKLVGTEHILLAIVSHDRSPAARILNKHGISADGVRSEILHLAGWGEKLDFGGQIIFDPSTKRSLESAMAEMAACGDEYITVEHLFLGITGRIETLASLVLEKKGPIRQRVREEMKRLMADRKAMMNAGGASGDVLHGRPRDSSGIDEGLLKGVMDRISALEEHVAALDEAGPFMGIGFDSHRLKEGRDLVIGGVTIPGNVGLDGHSDADLLVHAIIDALLGAMGEGDIGTCFPDSDESLRGISSLVLLSRTMALVESGHFRVHTLDSVVIAEKPRLAPYIEEMRKILSALLRVSPRHVSIKPKTAEGMGFVGSGEGMAAYAAVLLLRAPQRKEGENQPFAGR